MVSIASERLEDALQTYEDLCRLLEPLRLAPGSQQVGMLKHEGILANWRKLRSGLLDSKNNVFTSSDWKIHLRKGSLIADDYLHALAPFPLELHRWMHTSRRIFAIDPALQSFLLKENYSKQTWQNILFPFPAFVIELEKPIAESDKNDPHSVYELDTILVSWFAPTGESEGFFRVRTFRKKTHNRKGALLQSERAEYDKYLARNNSVRLGRLTRQITRQKSSRDYDQGVYQTGFTIPAGEDSYVEIEPVDLLRLSDNSDERVTEDYSIYSMASKLAVGLSLYLAHMSAKSESVEWSPTGNTRPGPLNIITDGAYICRVVGKSVFDPTIFCPGPIERLHSGYEMPPHHRRAHLRRPRGSSPNAQKTVRVEATFIHKDRMPPHAVAGGARTVVRFDELDKM